MYIYTTQKSGAWPASFFWYAWNDFEGPFCLSCTFIFRNEINWMKKNAKVSEKLVSPGLPGLQVATRLEILVRIWKTSCNTRR